MTLTVLPSQTSFDLPFKLLKDQSFITAAQKLLQGVPTDPAVMKNIITILVTIDSVGDTVRNEYTDFLKQYAVLDANGEINLEDTNFSIREDRLEAWDKEKNSFDERTFAVGTHKLKLSDLIGFNLTVADAMALTPILA